MKDAVLVVNAGSSSLKYALYAADGECMLRDHVDTADPGGALRELLPGLKRRAHIVGAGHRVVHGGDRYAAPVVVDAAVLEVLDALRALAPLHQPANLAGIRAIAALCPALTQVACFDTAFHQTQPEIARWFALPRALYESGIKRYGFHGLSYEYVAAQLPQVLGPTASGKVIVAHLGNGSSLCALTDGRSIASSMGFTALDGLAMGTRSGSIDPGVLLYLMDEKGMSSRDLAHLLYHESGLLGVSGLSHDMRALLASTDPRAKLAVELFVYRAAREIGSLAAALQGLDALVFTGGIGENAAPVRDAVTAATRWLGEFAVAVVPTNEEEMIARHTFSVLARRPSYAGA